MGSREVTAAIERDDARALGVNGTPAFVIGTDLIQGAVGVETFREATARARER